MKHGSEYKWSSLLQVYEFHTFTVADEFIKAIHVNLFEDFFF
jgi:hypothetical protein